MNIKRAKEEIEHTVRAYLAKDALGEYAIPAIRQRPILLMGPPGIGKTQVMEQAARECGVALVAYTITHHTRQSAVGLPFIRQRNYGGRDVSVTEYTMSEIIASVYAKMEATGLKEGILFIDEINCVSETLAPTMLQFLQCKTFGNQAVPAGWVIVAAGNPPEYNKSVRDFDIVTLDRVRRMDIEPDLPVWKDYARAAHIHSAILSYLELHPQNFYQINADVDGTQFVTARGWEDLSNLLDTYEALGLKADEDLIREYIQHQKIAEDFSAYLDLYYKYRDDYGVEDILAGQVKPAVYARLLNAPFDERLSLVSLILAGLVDYLCAQQKLRGAGFTVAVPTSPEQAALLQDKGFAWAFALRCLPREVERNLWSQAEFDSVTAKKLCELRERFWPDTVQFSPERMAVVLGDLYSAGATIVSTEQAYGIYFRKEDTLYFVELMAEDDRSAEKLMEAAREKEVIVEKAVITVGAAQNLFLGEGTRQDYGMIRFEGEPFDVSESYMRLMLENG